jgi:putative ABC transport system permease protein
MNIDDELRDHIERETLENIEAGMPPAKARAAALRKFGNVLRAAEETRAVWVWQWLERLWQDLKHASRLFAKSPGFAAIAVLSIALGTGANVAIFSAADGLVLRPLAVAHPDELVALGNRGRNGVFRWLSASYPDYTDLRGRTHSFQDIAAYINQRVGVTVLRGGTPDIRFATLVSGNFFQVMGVVPVAGRGFIADEDRVPGRDAVTVISYGTWQQDFGGVPDVVGRKLWVSGIEFTVVGVTPEEFTGTEPTRLRQALYIPLSMWPRLSNALVKNPLEDRSFRHLTLKGRLRPGITMSAAQAEMDTIGAALEQVYPATNKNQPISVETELQYNVERHPLDSGSVAVLSLLSMAVLGVACANVAGLLASRNPVRAREIALRLAIGASRPRLMRQLITESLTIALLGGIAGLGVGDIGILFLQQLHFPSDILTMPVFQMDRRALLFSLFIAMVSAFLFGLSPALQATRVDLSRALKNSDTSTDRRVRLSGRNLLVSVQVALSLVVVTLSVYVFQLFEHDVTQGPGFRVTQMAKVDAAPPQAGVSRTNEIEYFDKTLEAARTLPQAVHVSATSAMPLFRFDFSTLVPEGYPLPAGTDVISTNSGSVAEGYFATMEIPLLAGRDFRVTDNASGPLVAIVNEAVARHYWPGENAVGKRFRKGRSDGPPIEIVGVAKNSKYLFVAEPTQEFVYFPFRQEPRGEMTLLMQTRGPSVTGVAPLKEAVARVDRSAPLRDAHTIEIFFEAMARSVGRITLTLVASMAVIGIGLTMIGLYGLVSYAVSRRTREIGIRMAVGAAKVQISGMMLRQGMVPVWIGLVMGSALSFATLAILPSIMPVVERYDARFHFLVFPALILTTGLAALIPSNRASQVDPAVALRAD